MFSLIIDYWIDNGIYSAFIMIIINLIIVKSRLCYKITTKYWQNVLYSQLYQNKTQLKTSTKKNSAYFTHPDFSAAKIEKKIWANYANKYGIYIYIYIYIYTHTHVWRTSGNGHFLRYVWHTAMDSIEHNNNTESRYHWGITINTYFLFFCIFFFYIMMLRMYGINWKWTGR